MDKNRAVAVTGIGVFTSIGCNRIDFWNSLITGKSGIKRIQAFDPHGHKSQISSEVISYKPEDYFDRKESRKMARVSQLASSAAIEAVKDAGYRTDNGLRLGWPRKSVPAARRGTMSFQPVEAVSSYTKNVEFLEKIFTDAIAYAAIEKPVDFNLRLDAMRGLFDGSKTLFISAPEAKGIIEAILFAKRYGVKKIVLTDADETAWAVKDFLKKNNIPVLLDNLFSLPKYDYSDIKEPFKLPEMFEKEGIIVGLTYSNQAYGNLPFVAGEAAAYGLTKEEALQTVTLNTAKILGIDDITGSIEPGKDANIVVSTGDLLDMRTNNVELAFITGRNISLDNKHKQLYKRFEAKYDNMKQ